MEIIQPLLGGTKSVCVSTCLGGNREVIGQREMMHLFLDIAIYYVYIWVYFSYVNTFISATINIQMRQLLVQLLLFNVLSNFSFTVYTFSFFSKVCCKTRSQVSFE